MALISCAPDCPERSSSQYQKDVIGYEFNMRARRLIKHAPRALSFSIQTRPDDTSENIKYANPRPSSLYYDWLQLQARQAHAHQPPSLIPRSLDTEIGLSITREESCLRAASSPFHPLNAFNDLYVTNAQVR